MKKKMLSNAEIASFCGQIALLLRAGITPEEGLRVLIHDTRDSQGKEILHQMHSILQEGKGLSSAMQITEVFPHYVVSMTEIAEESGNLDNVMQSLSDYYEREESIAEGIKSAITYPIVMVIMMLLVILVLITKVLPIFQQVFTQLGTQISGISATLLELGNVLGKSSMYLIVFFVLIIAIMIWVRNTSTGKQLLAKGLRRFPLTKNFYDMVASGRFASAMALTLGSGMDTYHSLSMTKELVENKQLEDKIEQCIVALRTGANLAEALVSTGIFSNLYARMVVVGFKSGSIDIVMRKIASYYEKETDSKLHRIVSMVEPTLVIVLSLIVGLILLSVILPLMGIMSSIG